MPPKSNKNNSSSSSSNSTKSRVRASAASSAKRIVRGKNEEEDVPKYYDVRGLVVNMMRSVSACSQQQFLVYVDSQNLVYSPTSIQSAGDMWFDYNKRFGLEETEIGYQPSNDTERLWSQFMIHTPDLHDGKPAQYDRVNGDSVVFKARVEYDSGVWTVVPYLLCQTPGYNNSKFGTMPDESSSYSDGDIGTFMSTSLDDVESFLLYVITALTSARIPIPIAFNLQTRMNKARRKMNDLYLSPQNKLYL